MPASLDVADLFQNVQYTIESPSDRIGSSLDLAVDPVRFPLETLIPFGPARVLFPLGAVMARMSFEFRTQFLDALCRVLLSGEREARRYLTMLLRAVGDRVACTARQLDALLR